MARTLSIYRRKAHLVDLLIRRRPGIIGFRFGAAANFDAAFTTFETIPNEGKRSVSVPETGSVGSQFRDEVRFLFDPSDYVATAAALIDANPFFLRVESRNPDGTFNAPEAMHMVLPPEMATPNLQIILKGTVAMAASLAASLEIQLPMQCNDFEFQNLGVNDLYVAFSPTGGEYDVTPLATSFTTFAQQLASITQIFVRGIGGSTTMNAVFTLRNNPF